MADPAGTQRFDNAVRELVSAGADALCHWLLHAPPGDVVPAPARLTSAPIEADGVFRAGGRLLHVEFELTARPDRLHQRLVDYWVRLLRHFLEPPEQHVVVLAPPARLPGRYEAGGLRLGYHSHHLWEVDASALLRFDALLPLAVLARPPDGRSREELVVEVAAQVHRRHRGERRRVFAAHAATLANVHLGRSTVEQIFGRWTHMAVDLRELPMVKEARAEGREEGREEGRAEGREEGRAEGREQGRLEGRAELARRILEARLGPLGDERTAAVAALELPALDALADHLLALADLAELDAWLAGHRRA